MLMVPCPLSTIQACTPNSATMARKTATESTKRANGQMGKSARWLCARSNRLGTCHQLMAML